MNSSSQQPEGTDGSIVLFSERLWPGVGICSFLTAMTVSLGVAYGHAYGPKSGFLVGFVSTVLILGSLFINAPLIRVDDVALRAGKARLPLRYLGEIRHLDKVATKASVRTNAHAQAYLLVRSWVSDSVVITVSDTTDPHPYWQISSRRINALLSALDSAKIASGGANG